MMAYDDMAAALCTEMDKLRDECNALRQQLDAALDVVVDLGDEVRLPEIEEAKQRRKDAERWAVFIRHASLGFHKSPSWRAVIGFPVLDHEDQTISAIVDRAMATLPHQAA